MYFYCYVYIFLLLCLGICIVIYIVICVFGFILIFCVLFVCKCVLYYCHRVSTQLQLTKYIIYHTVHYVHNCLSSSTSVECTTSTYTYVT
jgi:hypothetical protein